MTNKDFYAFCRDKRKTESDPQKRAVLGDMYRFMWECGTTKSGVAGLIEHRCYAANANGQQDVVEAYKWLEGVFQG